jgi:threonine/homoserine/homoserine lactone efflux protein
MLEAIVTLIITTAALLGSPGPAPLSLAATSASYGINKALPFYFGILLGLVAVIVGAIFGVALLIESHPNARVILQILASTYLLYVTYKIATAPINKTENQQSNCPSFADGFILNLLNPKAYAAFFAIFSHFVLPFENTQLGIGVTATVCFLVAVVVDFIWLAAGSLLAKQFAHPVKGRMLRYAFAGLILLMVVLSFLLGGGSSSV